MPAPRIVARNLVAAILALALIGAGWAQTQSGLAFPADLVAPISNGGESIDAPLDVTAVYLTPTVEGDDPAVAIRFRGPFEPPDSAWRVSVVIGDPGGSLLRASLVRRDGEDVGRLELFDGESFRDLDPTEVGFDPSGLVVVDVPTSELPEGDGMRVEVVVDEEGPDEQRRDLPWFSRAALFGDVEPGRVPGGSLATVAATDDTPEVVVGLGRAPELVLAGSEVVVAYNAPLPEEIDGTGVRAVVDLVHVAPDFADAATATPVVEINRVDGTVTLRSDQAPTAPDVSGDRAWLRDSSGASGDIGEVIFDLQAVLDVVSEGVDTTTVGLGSTRMVVLDDDRVLVAPGVLGSRPWLDQAVGVVIDAPDQLPGAGAPTPAPVASSSQSEPPVVVLAAAVAALVALGLLVVWAARRRHRRLDTDHDDDFWGDGTDQMDSRHDGDDPREGDDPDDRGAHRGPDEGNDRLPAASSSAVTTSTGSTWYESTENPEEAEEAPTDHPVEPRAEPPSRRAQRAPTGVTIDAALVTDLVPTVQEEGEGEGEGEGAGEGAGAASSTGGLRPSEPDWWERPAGPQSDTPPPSPGDVVPGSDHQAEHELDRVHADIDELAERLRRLEEP